MSTVALTSLKGGCGKTSIALNLAAALQSPRRRVVVCDCDPQEAALGWAAGGELPFAVERLDAERGTARFRSDLERLQAEAELVILDCPPELAETAMLAALLADLLLIPCGPSALDLRAARAAVELVQEAREERRDGRPLVSLVPSRTVARTRLSGELPGALKALGEPVAPGIAQRVAVAQASVTGRTVPPRSPSGREFQALARHVSNRLRRV